MNMELLKQYRSIRREMLELNERINEIYSNAMFPTIPKLTGMPRASGYSNESMIRLFEKIEELTEFYREKQMRLNELCIQIEKEIDSLPSLERRIIRLRYLEGKSWKQISSYTGYSVSNLHKLHNKIES